MLTVYIELKPLEVAVGTPLPVLVVLTVLRATTNPSAFAVTKRSRSNETGAVSDYTRHLEW